MVYSFCVIRKRAPSLEENTEQKINPHINSKSIIRLIEYDSICVVRSHIANLLIKSDIHEIGTKQKLATTSRHLHI